MTTKRGWIVTLIAVLVLLNIAIAIYRTMLRPDEELAGLEINSERMQRISQWEAEDAVPLTSTELTTQLEKVGAKDCVPTTIGGKPVPLEDLSPEERSDLYEATASILKAYAEGTPEAIYQAMKDRGMILDPQRRSQLKTVLLKNPELTPTIVDSMDDKEFYSRLWHQTRNESHFEGILVDSSCIGVWRPSIISPDLVKHYSLSNPRHVADIWRGQRSYASNFSPQPRNALDVAISQGDSILMADMELVIAHDSDTFELKAPYLLRFWYNPDAKKWQPILFLSVTVTADEMPNDFIF